MFAVIYPLLFSLYHNSCAGVGLLVHHLDFFFFFFAAVFRGQVFNTHNNVCHCVLLPLLHMLSALVLFMVLGGVDKAERGLFALAQCVYGKRVHTTVFPFACRYDIVFSPVTNDYTAFLTVFPVALESCWFENWIVSGISAVLPVLVCALGILIHRFLRCRVVHFLVC